MFKSSIYISTSQELSEEKILNLVESKDINKKIEGMKNLIEFVSQGKINDCILHKVVKEILLLENNELKRLLYYFLEVNIPFISENEFLLLNNQIRKDLESPNEFIRGLTLRFVSSLESSNILNNCYKSIKGNTSHSVGYVRRNAYFCLGVIYRKIGMKDEISTILQNSLYKEIDTCCLIQAFCSLWENDQEKAIKFAYDVGHSKAKDFSLLLIERINDETFLKQFIDLNDEECRLESCIKLLDLSKNTILLEKSVTTIFIDLKNHDEYFSEAFENILKVKDLIDLSKYLFDVLDLVNPFNPENSKLCYDFITSVCKTKDVIEIQKTILVKFKEIGKMMLKSKKIEILILNTLTDFILKFGIFIDEIKNICFLKIQDETPALSFASLNLLNVIFENSKDLKILSTLINLLETVKYGKIFRFILSILVKNSEFANFEEIFNLVDGKFREICQFKGQSSFLCFQKNSKFLLSYICISMTEIYQKTDIEGKLKVQLIALFLGFTKLEEFCDLSTKSTIFLCVKSIVNGIKYKKIEKKQKVFLNKVDVLAPLEISFFKSKKNEKIDKLSSFLETEENCENLFNVVQLTGLSDPIYVEASISYTKYEIILNVLLINQTDNYLQNMLFDFGTSQNIKPIALDLPESMNGRSAISKKLVFRVLDSVSGFINGSVTFKYPNENGEYANQNYTLNFSEIKTDISDFLELKSCERDDFKANWKKMAWENVYSIKMVSSFDLKKVFDFFIKFVKGSVIDFLDENDILVGNILCTTRQNEDILFNVCIAKTDNLINLECRIRSNKEYVVKTMSNILSKVVKEIRIK